MALFAYEPPVEEQAYEDLTVSYLKATFTITGYQPDPEEVGIVDRRVDSYWNDPAVIENYKDLVSKYYGCHGALLEVAVGPSGPGTDIDKYPYFADFEPKRRDLYELVTQTGETMSRSLEEINIRKGLTTTQSHEVFDVFGGFNVAAEYQGTGGSLGVQGQWGTKDVSQKEFSDVRTTDRAREHRESFSHTTQLTQMYHQFDAYHLGTNRAVFFMLPRPHIVQTEHTFVNGPRLLEGIQEVFFVVMRPSSVKDICVEAYLETGHVAKEPILQYATSAGTVSLHVEKQAEDTSGSIGDDSNTTYAELSETYTPPDGWEVDIDRSGGYRIESVSGDRIEQHAVTEVARDHVTIWGRVSAYFEDRTWPESNIGHDGSLDMTVTVYIRKQKPDVSGFRDTLYITGRGLCCCPGKPIPVVEGVVFEKPLRPQDYVAVLGRRWPGAPGPEERTESDLAERNLSADRMWRAATVGGPFAATSAAGPADGGQMTIREANAMRVVIGRTMLESVNDPQRYPRGEVRFSETDFVARSLGTLIRRPGHPDNVTISEVAGLEPTVREKISQAAPVVSRGRLLQMSLREQQDRFGLSIDEARALRRALVGLEGDEDVPPPDRWEPPARRNRKPEAPPKKKERRQEARASSRRITSPDVVGMSLTDAVIALRESGLENEPSIHYVQSVQHDRDTIVSSRPGPGTSLRPDTMVELDVSRGE